MLNKKLYDYLQVGKTYMFKEGDWSMPITIHSVEHGDILSDGDYEYVLINDTWDVDVSFHDAGVKAGPSLIFYDKDAEDNLIEKTLITII